MVMAKAKASAPARQQYVAIFTNLHPATLRPVLRPIQIVTTTDSALIANAFGLSPLP
jgi:hypothetical protein